MGNLTALNDGRIVMRTPLFLLLLLLLAGNCLSMPIDEKKQVDSIIKLASVKRDSSMEGAEQMYYQALAIAKTINYNYGATKALMGLAMCYNNSSQKEK